ncbi:hypothetical protein [Mycobacteroides abscessus]|uniref:hypothetical protein n=1 Tax=Mycobacteroides abscessus TaxID=36809 RepID=UPI000C2562B6|nr:hypothetical protein [Mycobacteroides abscessus]
MSEIRSAFNDYLRSLTDEQWATLVAEVRAPESPPPAPEAPSGVSGGLQAGAELYRRRSGPESEAEGSAPSQQSPAVKGMSDGADLYRRHNGLDADTD